MQTKYSGIMPLIGLGLGSLGITRLLKNRVPARTREDMFIYADKDTGEIKNMDFDDDWRSTLLQWGPRNKVYHPANEWSFARESWEGLTEKEKNLLHRSGKPVHEWVEADRLPSAPVRYGRKIYSPDALKGKPVEFFKNLGLDDDEAEAATRGDFGRNQLKWVRRPQGFGMTDLKDSL